MQVIFADDNPVALRTFERFFSRHEVAMKWNRRSTQIVDAIVTDVRFDSAEMSGLDLLRIVSVAKSFVPSLL